MLYEDFLHAGSPVLDYFALEALPSPEIIIYTNALGLRLM